MVDLDKPVRVLTSGRRKIEVTMLIPPEVLLNMVYLIGAFNALKYYFNRLT